MRRILFPIDFSEPSYAASPQVAAMVERFGAHVTVLHVVPLSPSVFPNESAAEAPPDPDTLKHDLAPALDGAFRREFAHLKVDRVLDLGEAAESIARFADTQGVDLIMMPTWGRGPFRRLLLGSTTSKVVHDAQCPVWTSAHTEELPMEDGEDRAGGMVLCAIDQTPESSPVMEWAVEFAERTHAKLRLIHVLADSSSWTQTKPNEQWQKRLHKDALAAIEGLQRAAGVNAPTTIVAGRISEGVCHEAHKRQAGLVVVGRGMVQDSAGRFGKHAREILRSAPCPVISV